MPYTTQPQVEDAAGGADRLLQICNDGAGALDAGRLAQAQLYADMLIDGHAGVRFRDLLGGDGNATNTAIALAAAETVHQLKCQIGQNTTNDDNLAEARLALYKEIRDGRFLPKDDDDAAIAAAANVASEYLERDDTDDHPVSREGLKGFW